MNREDPVIYRRRLPHVQPPNGTFFVTFSLHGAITNERRALFMEQLDLALLAARRSYPEKDDYKREAKRIHEEFFKEYDQLLENDFAGARWLENPKVAGLVQESLKYLDDTQWRLIAWCIMPNHVHLIVDQIQIPLFRILQGLKIYTAIRANRILGRVGQSFWQCESFDHLIRDEWALLDKIRFTLYNPVKAGLCKNWHDWPWTGIHEDFKSLFDDTEPRQGAMV